MSLKLSQPDDHHVILTERSRFFRFLCFFAFLVGFFWFFSTLYASCLDKCYVPPGIVTLLGLVSLLVIADRSAELSRETGKLAVIRRRIFPFLSTRRTIPLDEILVPDVTLAPRRQNLRYHDKLTLLLQNGERIELHGTRWTSQEDLRAAHDAIWNLLELSPDEVPPDPFAHRPGGYL